MSFSIEPAVDELKANGIENAPGTSLRYQVPKIFSLLSTLYILKRVASKIYTSQSFQKQRHYAAEILVLCQHYA